MTPNRLPVAALALSLLPLAACSGGEPAAPAPAQVASASTPAAQPAALAPSDPAPVAAAASEPAPQPDMSKARGGGKR
ncbi:MAG TPA: hypothetical protein VF530_08520, partial [Planctomycetota bacterium]